MIFPSLTGSRLIFYRDARSALLHLVNQWSKFTYDTQVLTLSATEEKQNKNPALRINRTHYLRTINSRCARLPPTPLGRQGQSRNNDFSCRPPVETQLISAFQTRTKFECFSVQYRDGTTEPVSWDHIILRRERVQGKIIFSCFDPFSAESDDHTYMCVCVCFLPIHSGHQVRWTYQPGSHRRNVTQDFSSTFFLRCVP